ncbi:MAG: energy transducer TonB [Bdellovibrionales bacterium]|nr:energy transducer TonB [Bdellovibrionales bacterium]
MLKWRKAQESRKGLTAFFMSFSLHTLLAVALYFSDAMTKKKTEEISIDVVTLHDYKPDSKNTALVPQQKRRKESTKSVVSVDESSITGSKKMESSEELLKPDVAIGESDIESSLRGRAPVNETERYLAEIRDQIARQQTYPASSRAFREEGTVKVRLTLNRSGSVVKIELIESSPYKRLNDAAMRAATKASPFKPFPDETKFETWKITLPVRFILAQN